MAKLRVSLDYGDSYLHHEVYVRFPHRQFYFDSREVQL